MHILSLMLRLVNLLLYYKDVFKMHYKDVYYKDVFKATTGEKIANFSKIFKNECSTFLKSLFFLLSFEVGFYGD